jgi:hypothetical protein
MDATFLDSSVKDLGVSISDVPGILPLTLSSSNKLVQLHRLLNISNYQVLRWVLVLVLVEGQFLVMVQFWTDSLVSILMLKLKKKTRKPTIRVPNNQTKLGVPNNQTKPVSNEKHKPDNTGSNIQTH